MRICSVKDCGKKYFAKGYCKNHYTNFSRHGSPYPKIRKVTIGCKIDGCNKKHDSKGYCSYHYRKIGWVNRKEYQAKRRRGENFYAGVCKVNGCLRGVEAKQLCHNHYERFVDCGDPLGTLKKCEVKGCKKKIHKNSKYKYCESHRYRMNNNIPLDAPKGWAVRGKKNVNWKGGVAEYPDHYTMKRNRLLKLKQVNGKCEKCDEKAILIHHKDGSKNNHSLDNLIPLCQKCHGVIHTGRKNKTSKYKNLYGITLKEMIEKYGGYLSKYNKLHKVGKLKKFIKTNAIR